LCADILWLQEIWQRVEEVHGLGGDILGLACREDNQGGGTVPLSTNWKLEMSNLQIIKSFRIGKDSNSVKLRLNQNFFIWIVNFYNHDGSIKKIQKLFGELRVNIPPSEWSMICIVGDFNVNFNAKDSKFILLKTLAKHMGLSPVEPASPTHRGGNMIDFMIHGSLIETNTHIVLNSLTDHKALVWTIKVLSPRKQTTNLIDRKACDELIGGWISNQRCTSSRDFLSKAQRQ